MSSLKDYGSHKINSYISPHIRHNAVAKKKSYDPENDSSTLKPYDPEYGSSTLGSAVKPTDLPKGDGQVETASKVIEGVQAPQLQLDGNNPSQPKWPKIIATVLVGGTWLSYNLQGNLNSSSTSEKIGNQSQNKALQQGKFFGLSGIDAGHWLNSSLIMNLWIWLDHIKIEEIKNLIEPFTYICIIGGALVSTTALSVIRNDIKRFNLKDLLENVVSFALVRGSQFVFIPKKKHIDDIKECFNRMQNAFEFSSNILSDDMFELRYFGQEERIMVDPRKVVFKPNDEVNQADGVNLPRQKVFGKTFWQKSIIGAIVDKNPDTGELEVCLIDTDWVETFRNPEKTMNTTVQPLSGSNQMNRVQNDEFCKIPQVLKDRVDPLGNPLNDNLPCSLQDMQKAFQKKDGGDNLIKLSQIAARWVYRQHKLVVQPKDVENDKSEKNFSQIYPTRRELLNHMELYSPPDELKGEVQAKWLAKNNNLNGCKHDGIFYKSKDDNCEDRIWGFVSRYDNKDDLAKSTKNGVIVIGVRGTVNKGDNNDMVNDWVKNLSLMWVKCDEIRDDNEKHSCTEMIGDSMDEETKMHFGFAIHTWKVFERYQENIRTIVNEVKEKEKILLISGHSLGAGQSKLLAFFIAKKQPEVVKQMRVVNWAGPASFNSMGAEDYNNRTGDDDQQLGMHTWEINNFEDFVPGFSNRAELQDRIYRNAPPLRRVIASSSPYLARAQISFKMNSAGPYRFLKSTQTDTALNNSTKQTSTDMIDSGKTSNSASTSLVSGLSSSMSHQRLWHKDSIFNHDLQHHVGHVVTFRNIDMETKDAVTYADPRIALHHDMKWDYIGAYLKLFGKEKDWATYTEKKIEDWDCSAPKCLCKGKPFKQEHSNGLWWCEVDFDSKECQDAVRRKHFVLTGINSHPLPLALPSPQEHEIHSLPLALPSPQKHEIQPLPLALPTLQEHEIHLLPLALPSPQEHEIHPLSLALNPKEYDLNKNLLIEYLPAKSVMPLKMQVENTFKLKNGVEKFVTVKRIKMC